MPNDTFHLICGEFLTESGEKTDQKPKFGMQMKISYIDYFLPPGILIVLIQVCRCMKGPNVANTEERHMSDVAGGNEKVVSKVITSKGWYLDAPGAETRYCPGFGMEFGLKEERDMWKRWQSAKGKGTNDSDGGLGCVEKKKLNLVVKKTHLEKNTEPVERTTSQFTPAFLKDGPTRSWPKDMAYHHHFEVAAVCICPDPGDPLHGTVRGALTWGYTVDEEKKWNSDQPAATDRPSINWRTAANNWNTRRGGVRAIPGLPRTWGE